MATPSAPPLHQLIGRGLDAHLYTDLSTLQPDALVTPVERFYLRTERPSVLSDVATWQVDFIAPGPTTKPNTATELARNAVDLGEYLLECSGNGDPNNFGLMSVARWTGVRLMPLLERAGLTRPRRLVLISGVDHRSSSNGSSVPGASWIFTADQLRDAFLATAMNGVPLTPDHGSPVRLVVPGWYGCACIKWVNEISTVSDDSPATPQMMEFAGRTHQPASVTRAADFLPAEIDHAATPVRIEHWVENGRSFYRIVGVLWGGRVPSNALEIQTRPDLPFESVESCPLPASTRSWTLWSHTWRPASPGRYELRLRMADRSLRTRRLDAGFYRRLVVVREV